MASTSDGAVTAQAGGQVQPTASDSKRDILKSTGIVGTTQILSILIKVAKTKITAVLLGPMGVGVAGLYYSTLDIVRSLTGMGLDFSAVRDVAEANASGDEDRISRIMTILRRWMWITGCIGLVLLAAFSRQFSRYAFKDESHSLDFVLLAVVPLLAAISGGQLALLRGIRKIGDMALANLLGAFAGFCISVPLYWMVGLKGIVPAIILSAMAELALSWYFAHRLRIPPSRISVRETIAGGTGMIKLGFFMVVSGLLGSGTLYLVRILIADKAGIDGVGQFQAAWNLSATYVGLVLGAMVADYYPRLVSAGEDNARLCKFIDEQADVTMLLAGPLIVGMLGFVDIVVLVFYSSKFSQGGDILLWQLGGELMKVITWPLGFVILARNKGIMYVIGESSWNLAFLFFVWLFMGRAGIEMTGIAFLAAYLVNFTIVFLMCRRICGFRWTGRTARTILYFLVLCILTFLNSKLRLFPLWRIPNALFLVAATAYSLAKLRKIIDLRQVWIKLASRLGLRSKQ